MKTVELFTTTVDAVGMDTEFTSGVYVLVLGLGIPTLLFLLLDVSDVVQGQKEGWKYENTWQLWAGTGLVLLACIGPLLVDDFSSYSEHTIRRVSVVPKHVEKHTPSPEDRTVVAAVHDYFQKSVDRDAFKELGLDKECHIQRDLTSSPESLSVLCGGYSLDPVIADNATVTPVIKTSADRAWWPWSVDPHNVEVTASIEIDKE